MRSPTTWSLEGPARLRRVKVVLIETKGRWHGRAGAMMCRRLKQCALDGAQSHQMLSCISERLVSGSPGKPQLTRMSLPRAQWLLVAGLLSASAWAIASPLGEPANFRAHDCQQGDFRIEGGSPQDQDDVCAAALSASEFFLGLGLKKSVPITVSIVDDMPSELGTRTLGCFTPADQRIQVLSFSAATARGRWLGRSMDRTLYRSLTVHEVAHALSWCNASHKALSVRAREYVAYVVMFATMSTTHREAILGEVPGTGFEHAAEISETYYRLDPYRFGVEAYRHYLRTDAGPNFLRAALKGDVLPVQDD